MADWTLDQTLRASPSELAERASTRALNAIALAETLRTRVSELEEQVALLTQIVLTKLD